VWELDYLNNGSAYFYINGEVVGASTGGFDKWVQLIGVYDKKSIKLYVDGQLRKEKTYTNDINSNSNSVGIGRRYNGGVPLNGSIDEVRIYNRAPNRTLPPPL